VYSPLVYGRPNEYNSCLDTAKLKSREAESPRPMGDYTFGLSGGNRLVRLNLSLITIARGLY
jgi:hypothetical protein